MPAVALAVAVPLTVLCEIRLGRLFPRYGLELFVITVASLLYLIVRGLWPSQTVLGILVANLTVFVIGVSRSSRLETKQHPCPVPGDDQILETWQVRFTRGSRFHATTSALVSPIGLVGLVLIIVESVLILLSTTKGM